MTCRVSASVVFILAAAALASCQTRKFNASSSSSTASGTGAYACLLFDKAAGAPGGNIPALTLYTDSDDVNAAKAACVAKLKSSPSLYIDYQLVWMKEADLPAGWASSNLGIAPGPATGGTAGGSGGSVVSGRTGGASSVSGNSAYACTVFKSGQGTPGGDTVLGKAYSDIDDGKTAESACRALMATLGGRDFLLEWLDESNLPSDWKSNDLMAGSVSGTPAGMTGDTTLCASDSTMNIRDDSLAVIATAVGNEPVTRTGTLKTGTAAPIAGVQFEKVKLKNPPAREGYVAVSFLPPCK
ncbi:MAG: hypothetical protein IOD12_00345 [Silvanigrellales bacterium]|jgi:hypothetical protein|nr:hypothetical protein [Silvanigrellales bacterium]